MGHQSNRLTVCLIKQGLTNHADIVVPDCESVAIAGGGVFYTAPSFPHVPDWVSRFFKTKLSADLKILSSAARGLLLQAVEEGGEEFVFAVTFGYGRHLLKDDVIEERFGLKVVLNSVYQNSLRSIDKLNLGSFAKQSREQIGREGEAANFGIDIEQDLVRAVTGRSKIDTFGKMVSGKDAFATTAKVDIDDVSDFLKICLKQYRSSSYKADFDWIDQLEDVRSTAKLQALNSDLVSRIQGGDFDRIWLAPPDIVDWADVAGFKYARPKKGTLYDDLSIQDLVVAAGGKPVELDWLLGTNIYVISAKDDETHLHWSAFKCIYAELVHDGSLHILNAGKWYRVADEFTKAVSEDFLAVPDSDLVVPDYAHADEGSYNKALSAYLAQSICLDADVIPHGGGKSSIEFCDVMTADRKLLHVKRYSGSAQLSHLFAQGAVSAELFVSDPISREKLNAKLPDALKLADAKARPDPSKYEVVYAIVSKSSKPLDVPFFSKVTLRNAARRLDGFGYKVSKLKIPTAPKP